MANKTNLIQRRQPSKTSSIWETQARLTAEVIEEAAEALSILGCVEDAYDPPVELREDGVPVPYQWSLIGPSLFDDHDYHRLIQTIYACGWVCDDFPLNDFLPQVNRDVEGTVGKWGLPQIRLYLHTLMRGEKWCDGDSSVVLEAFASGALQAVARRLESDENLYEPL